MVGSLLSAFAAEQTPVQRSTCKQHFLNCRVHGRLRQNIATREFDLELGASAHELFDECPADSLRAADNQSQEIFGDLQAARIQFR